MTMFSAPIPRMASMIERRLLVTYSLDPDTALGLLPAGLAPQIVAGRAVAGVCLIRLGAMRPVWFTPTVGHRSVNAAHRIAVRWNGPDGSRTGVYIPRRHTGSRLARVVGGRLIPGVHTPARVRFRDTAGGLDVTVKASDVDVRVTARSSDDTAFRSRLFADLDEASAFFRKDPVGWSPTRAGGLEGLTLSTNAWSVRPAEVTALRSSFFEALPVGTARFDHALLMRNVPARWARAAEPAPTDARPAMLER